MPFIAAFIFGILKKFALGVLGRVILGPISAALSIGGMWIFHALNAVAPDQASWLGRRITQTYFLKVHEWAPYISEYLRLMTGIDVKVEDIVRRGRFVDQREMMEAIGKQFMASILNLILPEEQITPQEGRRAAERFMSANLQFQMSAWLAHFLGDVFSFGKFKSFKDLPLAISWAFGIGWLSWLVLGGPFRVAIAEPVEEYFLRFYRPRKMTMDQAIKAYQRGLLTHDELADYGARYGYDEDEWINLLEIDFRALSVEDLEVLYRDYDWEEEQVFKGLKRLGYGDRSAETKLEMIKDERVRKLKGELLREMQDRYEDGLVSETDLRLFLDRQGWKPEEVDLAVEISNLRRLKRKRLTRTDLVKAYQKGILGYWDVRDQLLAMGYSEADANVILALEDIVM